MRTILIIVQKEIWQLFRNPLMWMMVCLMPLLQLSIFPFTADYEIKEIRLAIVDKDRSQLSNALIDKITASGYFQSGDLLLSQSEALQKVKQEKADIILEIPEGFEKGLINSQSPTVSIVANAINALDASIGSAYLGVIMADYGKEIVSQLPIDPHLLLNTIQTDIHKVSWFNPKMDYKIFIIPGILAILVSLIGILMTAINIVREKEMGTIEQINVTPITEFEFILGKMIPYWIIGMITFLLGLFIAWLVYDMPVVGSIPLLLFFVGIFLLAMLGLGFLISIISRTQIQAMFACLFIFVTFVMLGGLFTPLESMPQWAQWINTINPFVYMVRATRMVLLKGSGFFDILPDMIAVAIMGVITNLSALLLYKKTN